MQQKKVLIVEDEKPVQQLITALVENYNAAVTAVNSGREARAVLADQSNHYDLAIIDLILPEITGWEVLEAIKSSPPNKDTPIIIFTAAELSEKELEKMLQKADAVVEKSRFNCADFNKIIERWL